MNERDTANDADSQRSDSAIMLQLTAYLDGELQGREIQLVEERLATDQKYRALMQELQQTWDVLDVLPSSSASSDFTRSTMKLVVEDAQKLTSERKKSIWTWPIRFFALLLLPCIAALVAFMLMRYVEEEPNRRLKRDFAVIKDYDVLSCDRSLSIEFLEALADNPRILRSHPPLPKDQRYVCFKNDQTKLTNLDSVKGVVKERVRTNREDFLSLDPILQQRLRELSAAIELSVRRDELRETLYRYNKWLGKIGEGGTDWSIVMDSATVDEKVSTIKAIVDERYLTDFARTMPKEDLSAICLSFVNWQFSKSWILKDLFLQLFGSEEEKQIQDLAREYSEFDRELFLGGARLEKIFREQPERIEQIFNAEDIDQMTNEMLSEDGKFFFRNADVLSANVKSEAHLLASWIVEAYEDRFSPEQVDLLEYLETLPTEQQDRLNNEYPDDRTRLLKEKLREESYKSN